ncbi:unnamed protein product [Phytophthora fragariaefolia]|uniref:Unnamed protein product n=1 Tax=Phytophthora fragariaefolia TaxID=1490495 RepID=A0A9W6YA88_9STRA|nr:unnamed protein product [Phytophthora fragariaefolia]
MGHSLRRRRSPSPGDSSSSSGGSEESSSGESEESSSDESDESGESDEQDEVRRDSRRRRRDDHPRRKNVKDLDLPTFTPSPDMPVDLALKGAEMSGHDKWSDHELYFWGGNKLLEHAASWWVDINRRMPERDKTWKKLKKALLRLRGRVTRCRGAESRSGSYSVGSILPVSDETTRKLVRQHPKPRTLEDAVRKATKIDDPMENVVRGMSNVGQPGAIEPSRHVVPMEGTMGPTTIIPGIRSAIPTNRTGGGVATQSEVEHVAMFTNPQGIYKKFSGKWDKPPGHQWNGKYWYEPMQVERKRVATRQAHEL